MKGSAAVGLTKMSSEQLEKHVTRTLHALSIEKYEKDDSLFKVTVTARGFLTHQVRRIVAILQRVGSGLESAELVAAMLSGDKENPAFNPGFHFDAAPSHGLVKADFKLQEASEFQDEFDKFAVVYPSVHRQIEERIEGLRSHWQRRLTSLDGYSSSISTPGGRYQMLEKSPKTAMSIDREPLQKLIEELAEREQPFNDADLKIIPKKLRGWARKKIIKLRTHKKNEARRSARREIEPKGKLQARQKLRTKSLLLYRDFLRQGSKLDMTDEKWRHFGSVVRAKFMDNAATERPAKIAREQERGYFTLEELKHLKNLKHMDTSNEK